MKRALRLAAREMSVDLLQGIRDRLAMRRPFRDEMAELLIHEAGAYLVGNLTYKGRRADEAQSNGDTTSQKPETPLAEPTGDGAGRRDKTGPARTYPNLKYAKPKYKNVESILKYVESEDDRSGLKLVIMNFND